MSGRRHAQARRVSGRFVARLDPGLRERIGESGVVALASPIESAISAAVPGEFEVAADGLSDLAVRVRRRARHAQSSRSPSSTRIQR